MRTVCRLAREVLDIAAAAVRPGVTTDYIDEIVHKACVERNVCGSNLPFDSLFLLFLFFPMLMCSSNAGLPIPIEL
jgi:methionine aminopeptidase